MKIPRLPLVYLFLFALNLPSIKSQECGTEALASHISALENVPQIIEKILNWSDKEESRCLLQKRAKTHYHNYDYKKAISYATALNNTYNQSGSKDSTLLFKNWEILSNSYFEMGLPDSVLHYGKLLLWELDARITESPAQLPRILEIVAMSFADQLQYDLALEWIDMIGYHLLSEGMGETENYMGVLYVKGVILTRQLELQKSDSIMTFIKDYYNLKNDTSSRIYKRCITLSIRLKLYLSDLELALVNIKLGENIFLKGIGKDTSNYISFLMNQSFFYLILGEQSKMQELTNKCLTLSKDFKKVPTLYARVRLFGAVNLFDSDDLKEGIKYLRTAISDLGSKEFYESSNLDLNNVLCEAISTYLSFSYDFSGNLSELKEAWNFRKKINDRYILNRINGKSVVSKTEIPYEDLEDLRDSYSYYHKLLDHEFDENLFEEGVRLSDQIKSDVFYYSSVKSNLRLRKKEFVNLFDEEEERQIKMMNLIRELKNRNIADAIRYEKFIELIHLRKDQEKTINKIRESIPEFNPILFKGNDLNIDLLKKQLAQDSATLINYFFDESDLYITLISPEKKYVRKLDIDSIRLDSLFLILNESVSNDPFRSRFDDSMEWELAAFQIYSNLIFPYENDIIGDLIIIPDGILNYLPFSCLLRSLPPEKGNYKNYDFFIKKYCTYYSPSVMNYLLNADSEAYSTINFLGIAPKFSENIDSSNIRKGVGAIKYNQEEVVEIAKVVSGETILGNRSTLENVMSKIEDNNVLHFATHAIFSNETNSEVQLILSDEINNNYQAVLVQDLLFKKNSPELVVLSACNSAMGELIQGEGISSLTNNFFKKGAKSVISTLWEANDFSMKEIFTEFYELVVNGYSVANSLRLAQINYLENNSNEFLHPFYWANVNCYGSGNLRFKENGDNKLRIYFIIGLIGLLILLMYFKLKR